MRILPIALLVATCLLTACHSDPPMVVMPSPARGNLQEQMIGAHRTIAQSEETAIDEYVSRRRWPMQRLGSGVRLWEYERGAGKAVEMEDSVRLRYDIEALSGKQLYDTMEEVCVAGRRRDMVGLDEALLALHYGSKARIILPSTLAYGIGGDGDRITQSTVLVIDLSVEPLTQ